jgi:RNA polymerase sigma-70 factor, ECF subfamily
MVTIGYVFTGFHLVHTWPRRQAAVPARMVARQCIIRMPEDSASVVRDGLPLLLPRLWRFAKVLCRDADFAHDLVQSTCVRAMERAPQFTPGSRLDHWTFAILASIWKNEIEKRRVRRGNGIVEADTIASPLAVDAVELNATLKQVIAIISALPEPQRVVAMLIYVEGFTFAEASAALDVPVGTLLTRMAAVRARLSEKLAVPVVALRRSGDAR